MVRDGRRRARGRGGAVRAADAVHGGASSTRRSRSRAFHFHLRNDVHHTVFATSTDLHDARHRRVRAGRHVVVRARTDNWLVPGRYFLSPTLAALRRRRVRGARRAHEPQHRDGRGASATSTAWSTSRTRSTSSGCHERDPRSSASARTSWASDLQRFWNLTWTLAATEFKLRFYGSVLGYAWTLARPFLFFGVIYLVFSEIAGLDANVDNYGVYILFGARAVPVLRRGDERLRALPRRARGPAAQDALPAPGDPAVGGADGDLQPRRDAGRRADLRDRDRRLPDLVVARAAA